MNWFAQCFPSNGKQKTKKMKDELNKLLNQHGARLISFEYHSKYFGNIDTEIEFKNELHKFITDRGEIYHNKHFVCDNSNRAAGKSDTFEMLIKVIEKILFQPNDCQIVNHFMMSYRLGKTKPEDFGLVKTEQENIFTDSTDGSLWEKRHLIDFGEGLEVVFCRLPYLPFDKLFELAFNKIFPNIPSDKEFYGAIGVMLNDYPNELLEAAKKKLQNNEIDSIIHKDFLKTIRHQISYAKDKPYCKKWEELYETYNLWAVII